ncbi:unnamed protein product [Mytilus edulis]|uniref:DUF4371 domain-containing protein n=1 Tax=Mytilus edulis TaxID=6550 RepID=A0A8S3SU87_MYTED|nr:unnamed protein product [Mytilus edulis]
MCQKAGLTGNYTNHSGKRTCATALYKAGLDEQTIMDRTGHRSSAVRAYKSKTDEIEQKVSSVLNPPKPAISSSSINYMKVLFFASRQILFISIKERSLPKAKADEVAEKVRNSGVYGLLVDEVTDLSVKQQMVCFVQYIDDSGLGHVDFLDIANVLDFGSSADADTLLKSVCHILSKNELDVRNCSSFVSDGASVMVGKKNGVAAKLKNIVPTLLSVHCICHRLALACTDTNKDIEYIRGRLFNLSLT